MSPSDIKIQPYENLSKVYTKKDKFTTVKLGSSSVQVWDCIDKNHDHYSLHVLKRTPETEPKFHRMVAILKECNGHPNLLHVKNVYQGKKFFFWVTASLDKPNLLKALQKKKEDPDEPFVGPKEVAKVVAIVLNALAYLHDKDHPSKTAKKEIVHGNICPASILAPCGSRLSNLTIVDFLQSKMEGDDAPDENNAGSDSDDDDEEKGKTSPFQPPEYGQTGPTTKGDMFSLGVLTFLLLTGKFPFAEPADMAQPVKDWHGIEDSNCRKFILALLEADPSKRASAKEINTEDAWCNSFDVADTSKWNFYDVMNRLAMINHQHEFQTAVRSYIGNSVLRREDRTELDEVFRFADKSNSGFLSKEEFETALSGVDTFNPATINAAFEELDLDKTGKISYTEFMTFAEKKEKLLNKRKLKTAFDAFDFDKSGYITAKNLNDFSKSAGGSAAFRGDKVLKKKTILRMIEKADQDGDGKISFDEFVDMMQGRS